MNIPTLFDSLSTRFGLLKAKMKLENSVNDYGLQLILENTVINILNVVYDYQLVNANSIEHNYPAVDGLCDTSKMALQITSTFSKTKILSTVKKYLKSDVYKTHNSLKFFFLKDIKKLNKDTVDELKELLNRNNISFNEKDCFLDYQTIYQKLYYDQDVLKTQQVIEVIDKVLGVLPIDKVSSFASLGISFENDEMVNTQKIVDILLKQGINIYITSEKLYRLFEGHRAFEYLILINEASKINHIKHFLIILSDNYIQKNLITVVDCQLLKYVLNENIKSKVLSFNPLLKNLKNIENKRFSVYNCIDTTPKSIQNFSEDVLNNFLTSTVNEIIVNPENIKNSLISIRKGFNYKIIEDNKQHKTILFFIENMDVEIIYIILKNKFSTSEAIKYLKQLSKDYNLKNSILLVPQNPDHKTRKVLSNFKEKLKLTNVFYIDEFLFEETLKNIPQSPILVIEDFVKPIIRQGDDIIHLSNIIHWIVEERNPSIAIIKAPGGIGKTTLVEKIHDELINKENGYKYLVLFIEANDFITHFSHVDFSDENEYDLYNIFKKCHTQGNNIDELLFYNNYRHGNILMIIDGVDEIISTITSFNLDTFLNKLSQFGDKIGKGKILLTSRDLYVQDIQSFLNSLNGNGKSITTYDLMPFNIKLASKYFKLNNLSEREIVKALNLLNDFVLDVDKEKEYVYPPFVLDMVLDYIKTGDEGEDNLGIFDSKYLLQNHRLDYIFHQTFNRESVKKSTYGYDLGIDEQVVFFSLMAIEKRGSIREQEILPLINQIGFVSNSEKIAESLRDHPFLREDNGDYDFIYRFLTSEFSITGIFNLLKEQSFTSYNDYFINVFALECNYNSIIAKGLLNKIKLDTYFNEEVLLTSVKEGIHTIIQKDPLTLYHKKAVSNLLLLLYEFSKKRSDIKNYFKTIIKHIFSKENNQFISNLYLYDVPDSLNMFLDFKSLYFSSSEINNYGNFIFCDFDSVTSFESSCRIENINLIGLSIFDKLENLSLTEENFDNVAGEDNSLHKVLSLKKLGKNGIEKELRKYLKSFYNNKILSDSITIRELKTKYHNKELINKITKEMHNEGVISSVSGDKIILNISLKGKINKFVYQGRSFLELKNVFRKIATLI